MKVVIDISEKIYDTIMSDEMPTSEQMSAIVTRIYQGTPLPKNHGRLIDADALMSEIKDLKKSPWYKDNTNLAYLPRKEAVEIIEEIIVGGAPTDTDSSQHG